MTQKTETLLWKRLKEKIPPHWHTTRIENRYGGGVPDVYMCADSVPFWVELKITNSNRVNVSSHQVAWNYAHCRSGGVSFYLVSPLSSPNLYLFDGIHGRELVVHGLSRVGSGLAGDCLWSGSGRADLGGGMAKIARGRVGAVDQVGSGSRSGRAVSQGPAPEDAAVYPWPGPGV